MTAKKEKIVLIDAMALAYRAYFAFISRPLRTKDGFPTSAIYGFLTQLIKVLEDVHPDYVLVAFDLKEPTFRHVEYAAYKANRQAMPEDMVPQIAKIKELVAALDIPVYSLAGYEADDIIGTVAKHAAASGMTAYMITPDKDYVQLVDDNINIVKPGKSTEEIALFDIERVRKDYGFEPIQMIDYLALVGDASDNVPGVKGIGEKTAVPLIQKYHSLENIYSHIDGITPPGVKAKLEANKENAFLSKRLVTIEIKTPIEIDLNATKIQVPDFEKVRAMFGELDFKQALLQRLIQFYQTSESPTPVEVADTSVADRTFNKEHVSYKLVIKKEDARKLADELSKVDEFVFDTETDGLDQFNLHVAGVSFCTQEKTAHYVAINPFKGDGIFEPTLSSDRFPADDFVKIFKPVFENKAIKKICQNGKFDIAVMETLGIRVENFTFDTMIAAFLIDPDQKVGMDDLSEKYLNYTPIPLSDLLGPKKQAAKIFDVDVQALSDYSAEDADITYRLYKILQQEIEKENLHHVAYDFEFPLVEVLHEMEKEGVRLDTAALKLMSGDLQVTIDAATQSIFALAGETFNINSTQQLQKILFDKLHLRTSRKTKTGYSTDAQSLEYLRGEHEIIEALLLYRQAAKLKSTYVDALPALISEHTGKVHTTYNQTITSTGRLSSINPNLQNIPIRTELGKEIRRAFVPSDSDHVIISADYSQIELRIMASMSGDERLKQAFIEGEDIHRRTAALVFRVPVNEVTPDMRRKAKEVNFGILYGIGAFGLKTRLGITQKHAKEIIDTYFDTFKSVKAFIESSVQDAKSSGFAQTLTGRRRFLRNINSSNRVVQQFEERVAVNMPIQGTAADMIKAAMINIHNEMKKRKFVSKMILQVHDELLFDARKDEVDELIPMIKDLMENSFPLNVPVKVEIGTGDNWLDAH
jgi:DNA polymerase I